MKKLALLAFAIALVPVAANAQQQQQQSISEYGLDLVGRVQQLTQAANNMEKQNATLQAQLKDANKRLEELMKAHEAPKTPHMPPLSKATPVPNVPPVKH